MHCLVTGGAGFIGSHLTERLVQLGHHVVVLDDLSTGTVANLDHVPEARLVRGSVLDSDLVDELIAGADTIYHLAAAVGVHTILDDPIRSLHTNLHGTETVLDRALRHRRPVLVASTSEVYGHNTTGGLTENAHRILGSPLTARWSYAEAKALDETLARLYWLHHRLPTVIVRPFNIVGPRQSDRYGMVIPRFVTQALRGLPLTVHGDGSQSRCFCHIDDIVDPLIRLPHEPSAHGTVLNLGSTEEVTIEDLAHRVIALSGASSPVRYVPYDLAYRDGYEDMQRRVPDIARARGSIGFEPRTRLDDIIRSVLDHACTHRPAPVTTGGTP